MCLTSAQEMGAIRRVPHKKPPFTIAQIKKAIPPHCFNRSLLRSFSYLSWDLSLINLLYAIATTYFHLLPHPFPCIAWPVYWLIQGSVATGVFVIAHECGHHAFSDHQWLDNTIGFLLHSALLVPFFSWKYSHRRHHLNTNSLDHDEAFIPKAKFQLPWHYRYLSNPLIRVVTIILTLTLGWPLYLMFNASGRDYKRFASHFYPYSPIYSDRERLQIYISNAGICAVVFVLYRVAVTKGLAWVLCVYGVPLLVVNGFNVLITYLQHTHLALPHYDSTEWDWLRGVLSTTDRDLGVLSQVLHNITDTHVAHHLFSTIPHYHAMEATQAIKPVLGNYYHFDGTPILKALWREAKECLYVEPSWTGRRLGVYPCVDESISVCGSVLISFCFDCYIPFMRNQSIDPCSSNLHIPSRS